MIEEDVNAAILLPSNMNMSEYEEKIFRQVNVPAAPPVRAKTIDDVIYLFGKHQGVVGVMLMNHAGIIISSTFQGPITGMYCGIAKQILDVMTPLIITATPKAPQINIIRVNSCSQEVIIAPVAGEDMIFVIVQNPEDRPSIASCSKSGAPVGALESRLLRGHMAGSPSVAVRSAESKPEAAGMQK